MAETFTSVFFKLDGLSQQQRGICVNIIEEIIRNPENFLPFQGDCTNLYKLQAVFEYTAQADDELSFKVGDIVSVISEDDSGNLFCFLLVMVKGWWKGMINGRVGFFPVNFFSQLGSPEESDAGDDESQPQSNLEDQPEVPDWMMDMFPGLHAHEILSALKTADWNLEKAIDLLLIHVEKQEQEQKGTPWTTGAIAAKAPNSSGEEGLQSIKEDIEKLRTLCGTAAQKQEMELLLNSIERKASQAMEEIQQLKAELQKFSRAK